MKTVLGSFIILLSPFISSAQTTVPSNNDQIGRVINEEVTVDFKKGTISPQSLPFDVPFILTGEVPKEIIEVWVTIINKKYQCLSGDECDYKCKACVDGDCTSEDDSKDNSSEPQCNDCPQVKDFRHCVKLCPWELNFLNHKIGNDEKNQFSIQVPPLKANESYQFFFDFKRSVNAEKKKLNPKLIEIIRSHYFNYMTGNTFSGKLDDLFLDMMAKHLKDSITAYYEDTYFIEDITENNLGATLNDLEQFGQLLDNTEIEASDMFEIFVNQMTPLFNVIRSEVHRGSVYWENDVLNDLSYKTFFLGVLNNSDDADFKSAVTSLNQLNTNSFVRQRILRGRGSLINPFDNLDPLFEVRSSAEFEAYIANLTTSEKSLKKLKDEATLILSNPAKRKVITLSDTDRETLNRLSKISEPTANQQSEISRIKSLDNSKARDLMDDLTDRMDSLYSIFEKIKENYRLLAVQFNRLDQAFLSVADNSFENQSFPVNSFFPTVADYKSRTGYYVVADIGLAHIFYRNRFDNEIRPYAGVSFHLGPINRQSHYKLWDKCRPVRDFWKNLNIMMGVTFSSLAIEGERDDTFGNYTLLTGVGLRLFEPVRLSGGVAWNNVQGNNPLVSREKLTPYPYLSLSFDLDVGKHLGKFGELIGFK